MTPTLSALLASLRTDPPDAAVVEIAEPGAARLPGGRRAYLHVMVAGAAVVTAGRGAAPVQLEEGDCALVLARHPHSLGDAPGRPAVMADYFKESHRLDRLPTIRFGGAGKVARLLTSAFSVDPVAHGVLRGLPDVVVSRRGLLDPAGLADALYGTGAMAMATALTDLCLVQALRGALVEDAGSAAEATRVFQHPQVSAAVKMINRQPGHGWTVAALAKAVGMSRSTFAAAFRAQIGQAPGDYVAGQRMEQAAGLLAGGTLPIAEIARQVGYLSDSSFVRAFRRHHGISPSECRRAGRKMQRRPVVTMGHWDPFLP